MSISSHPRTGPYVLMTAAHNEEAFLEATLQSVLAQTVRPLRWVIASDNSSDRTDEIVSRYANEHDFIRFLRISRPPGRNFGAKVLALQRAAPLLEGAEYAFIGNLDADVSLDPGYFEGLIESLQREPMLGIVGGFVYEDSGSGFQSRRVNDVRNVAHAAQLVRRQCYEEIGGYAVLKHGGEDWYAQICAGMNGWKVAAIPELKIFHHRHTGAGSHPLRNAFRLGQLDYSFGSDPIFETLKCLRRLRDWPYGLITLARLMGFAWPYFCRESRAVPKEFVSFLRRDQRQRLFSLGNRPAAQPVSVLPPRVES